MPDATSQTVFFVSRNNLKQFLRKVVKTTVLVQNMDDFGKVNGVYAQYFAEPYPARACYEVAKLPKGVDVEIEAIAVVGPFE